jgi:hypothetical protein
VHPTATRDGNASTNINTGTATYQHTCGSTNRYAGATAAMCAELRGQELW